jgi:Amt family ammonium transporter
MVSGAIADLGAITPAAGYVTPLSGIVIGRVAGILCYRAMLWRIQRKMDESLDAWAVRGVGGLWGTVAVGIFATSAVNGASGLIEGNADLLFTQIFGAILVMIFAFAVTYFLGWGVKRIIGFWGIRNRRIVGLDLPQHGELACQDALVSDKIQSRM